MYFNETGSICFNDKFCTNTYLKIQKPNELNIMPNINQLYYVKTDRIFKSLEIQIDGFKFFFDVSNLEHKIANEKRNLIYELKEIKADRTIVFNVIYSEKEKTTKTEDILKTLKENQYDISKKQLEKAFNQFQKKQTEADYFINKNAKEFLQEQFKLWSSQYLWDNTNNEITNRVNQLQTLKDVAFKIIESISQFENELVKVWNNPKPIKNENYVITLDRIKNETIIDKILNHENINDQIKEWQDLGIVEENFKTTDIFETDLIGKHLSDKYKHLPIDTKYFKDLEPEILSMFDNLDNVLDGWLIKSKNYQALNTFLPKFKEKVQVIYIDPPFNKDKEGTYSYSVKYKDYIWAILLENRLRIAREWLNEKGSIFVRCDYNGNWIVRCLMDSIFGKENFRNECIVSRGAAKAGLFTQFDKINSMAVSYDNFYWYSKNENMRFNPFVKEASNEQKTKGKWTGFDKGEAYDRPTMRYELLGVKIDRGQWKWSKERAYKAVNNYLKYIEEYSNKYTLEEYWAITGKSLEFIRKNENGKIQYWVEPRDFVYIDNNWLDITGYSSTTGFQTENSEYPIKRIIETLSEKKDIVMDFFLGSGTTTAVAHKLGRKWIGVEMGEHFYSVVLPRMKKVLAYDKSGISKEVKEYHGGGFFKYFELEQYEEHISKEIESIVSSLINQ